MGKAKKLGYIGEGGACHYLVIYSIHICRWITTWYPSLNSNDLKVHGGWPLRIIGHLRPLW